MTYAAGTNTLINTVNVSGDITIGSGATLNTQGYHLIAGNMIYYVGGFIQPGSESNGGAGGNNAGYLIGGNGGSPGTAGFGGSGGGGGTSYVVKGIGCTGDFGCSYGIDDGPVSGGNGGATVTGNGGAGDGDAVNGACPGTLQATVGATPTAPVFSNLNVVTWYTGGQAYVAGGGGGGGSGGGTAVGVSCLITTANTVNGGAGGTGYNGIILVSNNIYAGTVTCSGGAGSTPATDAGAGGGGGGCAVLFIYGTSYTAGTNNVGHGAGASKASGADPGANGGDGQVAAMPYTVSSPPLKYVPSYVAPSGVTCAAPSNVLVDVNQYETCVLLMDGGNQLSSHRCLQRVQERLSWYNCCTKYIGQYWSYLFRIQHLPS